MKRILISFAVVALFTFTPNVVLAQNTEEQSNGRANGRSDRIEKYKEEKQSQIAQSRSQRASGRCKAAQNKIASLSTSTSTVITNRKAIYERLNGRLDTLVEKLKLTGTDTTQLEASILELQLQTEELTLSLDAYDVALDDVASMDCESDTLGFLSALEAARDARKEIFNQSKGVREYVNASLKPELQSIKAALAGGEDEGGAE